MNNQTNNNSSNDEDNLLSSFYNSENVNSNNHVNNTELQSNQNSPINQLNFDNENLEDEKEPLLINMPDNINSNVSIEEKTTDSVLNNQLIGNDSNSKNIDNLIINPGNANNKIDDSALIKKFIGQNYEKITTNPFSLPGLLFAEYYLFYRKMFLYGFLVTVLKMMLVATSFGKLTFIINVALGFTANQIYLHYVKSKISKLKMHNPDSTLESICSEKGGTSILMTIGGVGLEFVLAVITALIALLLNFGSVFGGIASNLFSSSSSNSNNKYNGTVLYNTSINLNETFNMSVPSVFENTSTGTDFYNYQYNSNPNATLGKCNVSLGLVSKASSSKDFAKNMAKYHSVSNLISNSKINNIDWYHFSYSGVGTEYAYITEIDNKIYLYEFSIENDANFEKCNSYNDSIIKSISKK